ncbi:conserved hypothetical protein [Leishmania major strain Friedlin]|uniref:Uncharacterized protein n=1 Tax=Leishmania major TaxID=5664 RepID=Q4QCQ0_LEIMA|nr:conserved hypothetical protein [Leishmania major strain Friedlin]CAG9573219.1 hypothetical_protein_-_conserved [Leishmania major strain Friedlin]CAJ04378.1 conserved hypothetical protein [Leishmania major strain Friedlin]|eukprot:XP_001682898.1 conserved hypothetical protein [Leishmania major strain Friedlin]
MSAEAESMPAPQVTAPATHTTPTAVELKPKNTHRLNRILRKPKASLPPRKWHPDEEGEPRVVGVPPSVVNTLLASLSEEEKKRAATGLDPLSATQEALIRRAARFGLNINSSNPAAPVAPAPTFMVDEETLRRREERFKQAAPSQ